MTRYNFSKINDPKISFSETWKDMFQKIKENLKLSLSENCYNKSYFWTKKKPWIHCLECPAKHISFFSPESINFYIGCPLFSLGGSGSSFSKRRICSEYSPQVLVLREGRFDPQRKRMKILRDKDKIKAKEFIIFGTCPLQKGMAGWVWQFSCNK